MKAFLTCGLGFGDEGKGKVVSSLTAHNKAGLVVRYNGGAQAMHNVIREDGLHHGFAQFGSGTLEGARTFLGKRMLVNPLTMIAEAIDLESKGIENPLALMNVDYRCFITTPYHMAINRLTEMSRGDHKHGSVGMGIGECIQESESAPNNVILVINGHNIDLLITKLRMQQSRAQSIYNYLASRLDQKDKTVMEEKWLIFNDQVIFQIAERIRDWFQRVNIIKDKGRELIHNSGNIVFEGAQGALLHEDFGFPPYNTWSDTSLNGANDILKEVEWKGQVERIGIMRSYMTRHGVGPFVSESEELGKILKDRNNPQNPWQDSIRFGWMDLLAINYGVFIAGQLDSLAITHMDVLQNRRYWPVVNQYRGINGYWYPRRQVREGKLCGEISERAFDSIPEFISWDKDDFILNISAELALPVTITSDGPETNQVQFDR
jgi:adenylosuccinate synthase